MKKIYLAGPLFSLAEREFNIRFAQMIESGMKDVEVILPQKRASKFLSLENGMQLIFEDCLKMVEKADIVLAILDGPDADSGTSVELGYAYAIKTPIIGVRTDFRISEDKGLNLMLSNICSTLIIDVSSDISGLADRYCDKGDL
nr:nucleoside 2-deoxyribosyltransferase [uncultured Desulfobacter sp.]